MPIEWIGWDIGGAHLKAAAVDPAGRIVAVAQEPCPLWLGLDRLAAALAAIRDRLAIHPGIRHAVTMTGELADCFANREEGVIALVRAFVEAFPLSATVVFAGAAGFLPAAEVGPRQTPEIASANWLASGHWLAARLREALFMDVGSTTTDILPIHGHKLMGRGYTDAERMRYDELLYTGLVRTPLMALASRAPVAGEWVSPMAEVFATTADVYRLTGELPEHADQHPAADGGPKTLAGSRRRLARMFGRDEESLTPVQFRRIALYFREQQLARLRDGLHLQLSRDMSGAMPPLVGAGVGRCLIRELAQRMGMDYLDFGALFDANELGAGFQIEDCAPAAAVACLAQKEKNSS